MGFTVWRKRHGDWEPVMADLTNAQADQRVLVGNSDARTEHTGWSWCKTVDGVRPKGWR